MEPERLEKQFQMWVHFLWMIWGVSITFAAVSFGNLLYSNDWFGNYVGGIWLAIELLATSPGFYLWLARPWKALPFSSRLNTIFGYFVTSWINLLSLWFIASMTPPTEYYLLLVGSAIAIVFGYTWMLRKISIPRDEIFP